MKPLEEIIFEYCEEKGANSWSIVWTTQRVIEVAERYKKEVHNQALLKAAEKVFNQTTHPALSENYRMGYHDCQEESQISILSLKEPK